jgi:hypothetical protein
LLLISFIIFQVECKEWEECLSILSLDDRKALEILTRLATEESDSASASAADAAAAAAAVAFHAATPSACNVARNIGGEIESLHQIDVSGTESQRMVTMI